MKKQTLYAILGVVVMTLACSLGSGTPATPTQSQPNQVETVVAATMQAMLTAAPTQTGAAPVTAQVSGIPVSSGGVSFVIPSGLAAGANPKAVAAVTADSGAPWDVAPAHLTFTLTGYPLQGKFHEPAIFVFPADDYAKAQSGAAEQIDRIKKIQAGFTPMKETLPIVPFFNAGPLIAANIKLLSFENGSGVRVLTQYAQYSAPINNHDLFYHFQGLTSDGKYYVIVILPITAPILAEDEKPEAVVPPGGVPIPATVGPNDAYYASVAQNLNALAPDGYGPSLNMLDVLVQSIQVTNP